MNPNINNIFKALIEGKVDDPILLSEHITILSAHQWNVSQDMTNKEIAFARVWNDRRHEFKTNKECEMALKLTKEWQELERAKNVYKTAKELIIAARKRLNTLTDLARNNY